MTGSGLISSGNLDTLKVRAFTEGDDAHLVERMNRSTGKNRKSHGGSDTEEDEPGTLLCQERRHIVHSGIFRGTPNTLIEFKR